MMLVPGEKSHVAKIKVLVVEDERSLADMFVLLLNTNGFLAHSAYSGFAALDAAESFGPDVAICDIEMPGLDGVRTAMAIKQLQPTCRILLISGMGEDRAEAVVRRAEANPQTVEIIEKPVHPCDLINRIRAPFYRRTPGCASSHYGQKQSPEP